MSGSRMETTVNTNGNNTTTPTDVLVEHNPLPDDDDKNEDPFQTVEQATENQDQVVPMIPIPAPTRNAQIRRTSSSRPPELNNLPRVNCPEKIVICVDISKEMDSTPFRLGDGTKFTPLHMVKRILEIFLHSKKLLNAAHEFALVVMHNSAVLVRGFTSDLDDIMSALQDIQETVETDQFDIGTLMEVIMEHCQLVEMSDPLFPPPYITRVLLLYGRSQCVPDLKMTEELNKLLHHSYFFVDAFYIHEASTEDNHCQEVFDVICELDQKGTSYIFEVARNTTKLHNCMAKLLAHPLQRPLQDKTNYNIPPPL